MNLLHNFYFTNGNDFENLRRSFQQSPSVHRSIVTGDGVAELVTIRPADGLADDHATLRSEMACTKSLRLLH